MTLSDEKKKTKAVDSELNPVWNEVMYHYTHAHTSHSFALTFNQTLFSEAV